MAFKHPLVHRGSRGFSVTASPSAWHALARRADRVRRHAHRHQASRSLRALHLRRLARNASRPCSHGQRLESSGPGERFRGRRNHRPGPPPYRLGDGTRLDQPRRRHRRAPLRPRRRPQPEHRRRRSPRPTPRDVAGSDLPGVEARLADRLRRCRLPSPVAIAELGPVRDTALLFAARILCGPPRHVPAGLDRDGLEAYRLWFENELNWLTAEAETWADSGRRRIGEMPMVPNEMAPTMPYWTPAQALRLPESLETSWAALPQGASRKRDRAA